MPTEPGEASAVVPEVHRGILRASTPPACPPARTEGESCSFAGRKQSVMPAGASCSSCGHASCVQAPHGQRVAETARTTIGPTAPPPVPIRRLPSKRGPVYVSCRVMSALDVLHVRLKVGNPVRRSAATCAPSRPVRASLEATASKRRRVDRKSFTSAVSALVFVPNYHASATGEWSAAEGLRL